MEKKLYELNIDPDFEKINHNLTEQEYSFLEEDILEHGCITPLVVWGDILIDGHNRYKICHEYNVPFSIETMDFPDRTEAAFWIIKNQIGRRNLSEYGRCELLIPIEDKLRPLMAERKRQTISAQRKGLEVMPNWAGPATTREAIEALSGVPHTTYERAKKISLEADEDVKKKLRSGDVTIWSVFSKLPSRKKPSNEEKPAAEVTGMLSQKTNEREEVLPVKENPPVVAAYLEKSMPFEPVQRDATTDEITEDFSDFLEDCLEDASELIGKLTAENANAAEKMCAEIDAFSHRMKLAIEARLHELED
ncbi:MAG: hypothetical protein IJV40_15825 [Oscillospiraceae bacterium]|nr:hypothetical protein [Oscillospiraceae bacterium]